MEDNYRNDDFEEFVRGQADQHRMFPSEKVWSVVDSALHPRKKWYGFGLAFLLLLTGGAVTWVMNTYPVKPAADISFSEKSDTPATIAGNNLSVASDLAALSPFHKQGAAGHARRFQDPEPGPEIGLSAQESLRLIAGDNAGEISVSREFVRPQMTVAHSAVRDVQPEASPIVFSESPLPVSLQVAGPKEESNSRKDDAAISAPLLPGIESVVNSFKAPSKKISWQFFITPTISNRRLTDNKAVSPVLSDPLGGGSNFPFASATDVNNAVTHKPDLGLQIGVTGKYAIGRNLRIIGGFQFNVNRYDIKAFLNNGEVAHIELQGTNAAFSTWSSYRSQGVSRLDWLKNYYFSVSVPIGAELIVYRDKKAAHSFGLAATIQPTYVLQNKAYLVSTDYKNYAQVPWLVRDANISTGLEAFVQHNKGKTQWQVGPQFRYQLLSSFNNKYPIRENLFDFGVKFGVTLNK